MRRPTSIIHRLAKLNSKQILSQQPLRAFQYENLQTSRNNDIATVQKRHFWPFSGRRKKATGDQVTIHMPKKYVKAKDASSSKSDKYKAEIQEILNSPTGTIKPSLWLESEKIIEHVAEKDSIPQAFRLLDRLALEPDASIRLNHDSIYFVVQKWLSVSQARKTPLYPPSKIWQRIESYHKAGIAMESRTYHRIIEGLAIGRYRKPKNDHGPVGPQLAETILERMMELSKHKNPVVRPSTYTFNATMVAWENAASTSTWAKSEAPQRTLALLNRLKTLYETGWGIELMPDKNTYRRVMNCFAHNGDGDQAEALLEELYERYLDEDNHDNLLPTTPFFSLVLYAWSKSKDPMAAERASVILERMLELEASGEIPGLQVTAACFNIVMVCFSRLRTRESTMQVQALFDRLVELSKNDRVKRPIGGSYTALLTTWSHFDVARAEDVFWKWKEEHDKGNCEMRMDSKLLGTLVAGWYKSKSVPDSAERCDKLLQYALNANLKSFEPSAVVFNMTINAYCRKKTVAGVERAEALLRQMEDYQDSMTPTIFSYVPIIHNWAALGRVERAEEFLLEWYSSASRDKKSSSSPSLKTNKRLDTQTVNSVLKGWISKVKSNPQAASKAESLLLSMRRLGITPNALSFQHVLECRQRAQRGAKEELNDTTQVAKVLSFLEEEYKSGYGNIKNESYLNLRKAFSLMVL